MSPGGAAPLQRTDSREAARSVREKAGYAPRASIGPQVTRATVPQSWEAPAWAKPGAGLAASGNSVSSRPARSSSVQDLAAHLDRAVQILQAAFSSDQVEALASAPVWHFATSVASVRAMAGSVTTNYDAQSLRMALEALSTETSAGRLLRHNLVHQTSEAEVTVDFQALQAELGAFVAAAATLNLSQQKPIATISGIATSGDAEGAGQGRLRRNSLQGSVPRGGPRIRRTIPEGIQSAGGRGYAPGTFKVAQSSSSTPEDASPVSNGGFLLPGSCLVSPSALTRKQKERPEPAKLKGRQEDGPKLRKPNSPEKAPHAPHGTHPDVTSQSEAATPLSEEASTAVPRTSSTLCSEGSLSERHPAGRLAVPMERRNEAEASLSNKVSRSVTATSESVETGHLRWPETPPAIVARRREQSAEAPERPSPRPAAGRSPSHPRAIGRQSVEEKAVVHSKKDFKKDKESLLKSVATLLQSGQSANVNSLDFYAVGRLLGKGAFGKVNVAVHKLTEELSAMKQCDRRRMTEAGSKKCFLQEVAIMKRLTGHANVIQLFEVVETPSQIVLVMEFATGGDLLKYVRNRRRLAEPCAKDLFKQLLEGLEHIHKKMVVHRDIKLENLLLDPFSCVKIADFGVAAVVQPEKKLHDHCGTPSYIAPEILQEEGYEGFPVDVWSSGIALYAMLCGRLPFKGKSMSELKRCILRGRYPCPEHLSTEAQQLIASMLTLEPRSRATVRSVLAHPFLQGLHSRAREIYGHLLCPKPLEDGKVEGCADILRNDVTRAVLQKVAEYGISAATVEESITKGKFDHASATFHLLAQQVVRGRAQAMKLNLEPSSSSQGDQRPQPGGCDECEDLDGGKDDVSTLIRAAPC